jgi:putative protease
MTDLPELLAPAGSWESLEAAVYAGADAVYLSGKRYGARKYASNFSDEDLLRAIAFAHLHGVRVYVTVNTLLTDNELPELARYLYVLFESGTDAILVQDPGVAVIARTVVPDLPVHASTQMTIFSIEGMAWAQERGFSRVVLARETPLEQVRSILNESTGKKMPGVEVFIHGALCYSVSGQCLLSSVIGGRSGNRGMCAQPCRKPYHLVCGPYDNYGRPASPDTIIPDDQYLLSTRDLCTYPFIDRIAKSGIESLKIEGRMRSPEYVAVVSDAYRRALDSVDRNEWSPSDEDTRDLALAFNRGFTGGYLFSDDCMGRERPDPRGVYIGTVISCRSIAGQTEIEIKQEGKVVPSPGDGMVFTSPGSDREEGFIVRYPVKRKSDVLIIRQNISCRSGMQLWLTGSPKFRKKVELIRAAGKKSDRHRVPVDLNMTLRPGEFPVLSGTFVSPSGSDIVVSVTGDVVPVTAETTPLGLEQIAQQLEKSGGTAFGVRSIDLVYDGELFLPVRVLNDLRRLFFEEAESAYVSSCRPSAREVREAHTRLTSFLSQTRGRVFTAGKRPGHQPCLAIYVDRPDSVRAACESGIRTIYYEPALSEKTAVLNHKSGPEFRTGVMKRRIRDALAICEGTASTLVWKWPHIVTPGFSASAYPALADLLADGLWGVMVETVGFAERIHVYAPAMRVYGGSGLNICNSFSVADAADHFFCLTLSPELSIQDIRDLGEQVMVKGLSPRTEVIVQGNLETIVSRDNLLCTVPAGKRGDPCREGNFLGLEDETGRIFPFFVDDEGWTHILNSAETCLINHIPSISDAGVNSFSIDARRRGSRYVRTISAIYSEALLIPDRDLKSPVASEEYERLKQRVQQISLGGITAMHLTRERGSD